MNVTRLWNTVAVFEEQEQKNDSKKPLLAKARQDARMEAYVKLMDSELETHRCSLLVGKHVTYCMDCGQIYFEYSDKRIIKRLFNPTEFAKRDSK